MDKVVKVKDVESFADNLNDHKNSTSSDFKSLQSFTGEEKVHKTSSEGTETQLSINEVTCNDSNTEQGDTNFENKLFSLPEIWQHKQVRPRSCELVNIWTPCLKKAVSHLQLLQNAIEDCVNMKQNIEVDISQKKSHGGKRLLNFFNACQDNEVDNTSKSHLPTDLAIFGKGGTVEETEDDTFDHNVPFLDAEGVFKEILSLLANLEKDRQETHELYLTEISRTKMLQKKIDDLQETCLRELPLLIQREHETCLMDFSELQWHVIYSQRVRDKVQHRYTTAERLNKHLKEDIAFIKQHTPLVQEKLVLEVEAMDKIRKAQGEADQELTVTKQRLAKTDMKYTEAITKAETERGFIRKELDNVKEDLANISQELTEAKLTYNAYVHQINDINTRLIDNEQEMKVLQVKNENAKMAEEMQATKVQNLQSKITQAIFEHRRLENENDQLDQDLKTIKSQHNHTLEDLERQVLSVESKRREIIRKNQESEMLNEEHEEKINQCIRHKLACEKNIVRINKDIERCGTMLQQTMENYNSNASLNSHLRGKLQIEKEQAFQVEQKLKTTLDTLRKQVKDEMHTKTVLHARITSDSSEIEKTKLDSAKKRDKAQDIADEVQRAVSAVLEKVEKLRSAKQEREKHKANIQQKLEETEAIFKETNSKLSSKVDVLQPHHNALKSQLQVLNEEINKMEQSSNMMNKQIEEMDAAQRMMEKSVKASEEAITTLTAELDELNLQVEAGQKLKNGLQKQYDVILDRLQKSENSHKDLMSNRDAVLKKHEHEKEQLKNRNHALASKYRQLQNEFLLAKEEMLKTYDDRIKTESSITDVKQLMSIQCKLHGALCEYMKLSQLYNNAEVAKLEQESGNNAIRVSELQSNMEKALEEITQFLNSQMSGQRARESVNFKDKRSQGHDPKVQLPNLKDNSLSKTAFGQFVETAAV